MRTRRAPRASSSASDAPIMSAKVSRGRPVIRNGMGRLLELGATEWPHGGRRASRRLPSNYFALAGASLTKAPAGPGNSIGLSWPSAEMADTPKNQSSMTTSFSTMEVAGPASLLWVHWGPVVARHHTRYRAAPGEAAQLTLVSSLTAPSILT